MSFLSTKEDNVTTFIREIKESFKLTDAPENKMLSIKKVLVKFNTLKDHEKVAIIMSVINDDKFHLRDHPRIYNEISLIQIKKITILTICTLLTISWLGFIALLASPDGKLINLFVTVYDFIMSHFSIIFF